MSSLAKTIKELEATIEELTITVEKLKSLPKRGEKPKRGDMVRCVSTSTEFHAIFLYESNDHVRQEDEFYWVISENDDVPQKLPVDMFKLETIGDCIDFEELFNEFREE